MRSAIVALMIVAVGAVVSWADGVPPLINYQGEVRDDTGTPLATGFYNIDFRIYNRASAAEGGTLLWSRRYNLYVMTGRFNVILGQGGEAISGDNPALSDLMAVFASYNGDGGDPRYLSLAVSGGTEFSPRQRLLSAPYAVRANTAAFADTALNASNAASATHAVNADHASNADLATSASTASQAGNADNLGGQPAASYAMKNQFAAAPAGNWQAQFWDGGAFHNGPLYWMDPTIGVGGMPGVDANVGLRMVAGSLHPKVGEGDNAGIIYGPQNNATHKIFQNAAGDLCTYSYGASANHTISAQKWLTAVGEQGTTVSGGSGGLNLNAGTSIQMNTPRIVSSALKDGARIAWPSFSGTVGQWAEFTAEGDGLLMVNANQMLWEIEVPDHMDGDYINGERSLIQVRFAKNAVDDTSYHTFVWPLKNGERIKSRLLERWGGYRWHVWVIYFN